MAQTTQQQRDEQTRFECTIAAILAVASLPPGEKPFAQIIEAYGGMVQYIRRNSVDLVNPPISGNFGD